MKTTTKTKFKQTGIGLIPKDWVIRDLKSLCLKEGGIQTGPFGSQLHNRDYVEEGTPIITVEHLGENRILHENLPKVSEYDRLRLIKYSILEGDIVFSRVGSVDRRATVKKNEEGWLFSGRCLRVRVNKDVMNPWFLSYYFGLEQFRERIRSYAVGATMPSLNTKLLSEMDIIVPPMNEQVGIAKILSDLDAKIELNRQMNNNLEAIGKAIFKRWFIDFEFPNEEGKSYKSSGGEMVYNAELGKEVPKGWKSVRISEICSTQYGYTASATAERIGPRFLRITDMNEEAWIDWSKVPYCTISQNKIKSYALRKGDIVVSRTGASFGRAAIVEEDVDAVFASYLVRLETQSLSLAYYLFYLLRSPSYTEYARAAAGGSAQPQFNAKMITATITLLPAPQNLEKFLLAILPLREKIKLDLHESDRLARIRDLLLPKLMSGKIRVPVQAR